MRERSRYVVIFHRAMGGGLGQGDLFNTCYYIFPAVRPRGYGRPRIEINTQIYERRREVGEVAVLIVGAVPVAVDEAMVRAGAGPVPCDQVWLSAKSRHSAA